MTDEPLAVLPPFAALSLDIVAWRPELRPCLDDAEHRLGNLVKNRGIRTVMIDLPELGNILTKGLSSGWVKTSNLPSVFGSWEKGTYIFRDLILTCFNEQGELLTPDPNEIFFLRQVCYLWKKIKKECSNATVETAVREYQSIEASMADPTLEWGSDHSIGGSSRLLQFRDRCVQDSDLFGKRRGHPDILLRCLDQVAGLVIARYPTLHPESIAPKHGPGAVADVKTGSDKYQFPNWPDKLDNVFNWESFALPREDLHLEASYQKRNHEPPAKLLAVPKTLKSPRLIASEPTAHQFLQQGLLRWMRENLPSPLRTSIHFLSQEPSRESAMAASRGNGMATVDLSMASDRLSCWVVERMFQYNWDLLNALHAVRTRWLVNATGSGPGFYIKLRKYAAQGSAVTFPLQSIVYAICCYAVLLYLDGKEPTWANVRKVAKKVRVFGDDIILPSYAVWDLALLFEYLGLKVNENKTHWKGFFRESCGIDAWKGSDVSPLYLSSSSLGPSAEDLVSWVDVSNNAHKSGLFHLASWMQDQIPKKIRKLIPISNTPISCISLATYSVGSTSNQSRYSHTLHREEVLGFQVRTKPVWQRRDSYQSLLQFFVEDPSPNHLTDPLGYLSPTDWRSGHLVRKRSVLTKRWVSST